MSESHDDNNKLASTLLTREACRKSLLEMRRELNSKADLISAVNKSSAELALTIAKTQARLVELTTEATKLLHADLAGVVGKQVIEATPTA